MLDLRKLIVFLAACLIIPSALMAQGFQIGTIGGVITDQTGAVLPGVTVTATSVERNNSRSEVTDEHGRYRIPSLPLGSYKVEAALSGFTSASRTVNVEADKVTTTDLSMRLAGTTGAITVTAQSPVVDPQNQATTTRLSTKEYEKAPVGRSYQSIVGLTPGASTGTASNPTVNGALSSANQYLFDGVDTTDPTTGTFSANLNFEAIQEVNVLSTGMSAEYGRATGAVVNVITKSGTNTPSGSLKLLTTNDKWNKQNGTVNTITKASLSRPIFNHTNYRETGTLGGPIWRDHLWGFAALEKNKPVSASSITTQTAEEYSSHRNERFGNYRLDAQLTPSHHLTGKYSDDPITGIANNYVEATDLNVITNQGQGGNTKVLQYNGVFGNSFTADAMYSDATSKITVSPYKIGPYDNGAAIYDFNVGKYYNGMYFGQGNNTSRPRKQLVAAGTYFAKLGDNTHEFKAGIDNENIRSLSYYSYGNNRLYYVTDYNPKTGTFTPVERDDFDDPGPATSKGSINAFYARDRFGVGSHLNAEVGLRYEKQNGHNDAGQLVMKASSLAPRLSAGYDVFANGRSVVSATAGRYYDFLLQSFADQYQQAASRANYTEFDWDPATKKYVNVGHFITAGGSTLPPALNLKPGHMDEYTFGFQQQLTNTSGAGVKLISRKWGNQVEDIYDFDAAGNIKQSYINWNGDKRTYKALQATFDKRFSTNWAFYGNYTYSKTKGNDFASFGSTNLDFSNEDCRTTADPTVGTNGVMPCSQVIASQAGLATYDVPHVLNAIGTYGWKLGPVNLTYGAVGKWQSGLPYSKVRTMTVLRNGKTTSNTETYYYEGRGSDRLPSNWTVDNSLEGTFRVMGRTELGLKAEVFNITNNEEAISTANTNWCNAQTTGCATTRTNFGAQTARSHYQTPRSYRFTALLRF
jgi:outer membrane receptor protein involved in Fe transport